jgi:hypothetical protein
MAPRKGGIAVTAVRTFATEALKPAIAIALRQTRRIARLIELLARALGPALSDGGIWQLHRRISIPGILREGRQRKQAGQEDGTHGTTPTTALDFGFRSHKS